MQLILGVSKSTQQGAHYHFWFVFFPGTRRMFSLRLSVMSLSPICCVSATSSG